MTYSYKNTCLLKKTNTCNYKMISWLLVALLLLIYLLPLGKISGYIPYFLIGAMFVILLFANRFHFHTKNSFLYISLYALISNLFISTAIFNYSFAVAIKTSIYFLVPFLAINIGVNIKNYYPTFDFKKVLFFILFIELIVCAIQIYGGSYGYRFISLFGSEKYSSAYYIAGNVNRAIGTIGNPNDCGTVCSIFLLIILCKSKNFFRKIISIAMCAAIVYLTKSRTALIVLFAVIMFSFVNLFNNKTSMFKKITGLAFSILIVITAYFMFSKYVNREISFDSLSGRITIWNSLIESAYSKDGIGLFERIFGLGLTHAKSLEDADNEYLFFFLSTGIIGSLIIIFELFAISKKAWFIKNQDERNICISLILIWLLYAITASFFTSYTISFVSFVFIGFSLADNLNTRES